MAYVITQKCLGTCDTACADVCPVDAIHGPLELDALRALPPEERKQLQLYIDPESCISCGACRPECPASAIYDEDDVPAEHRGDIAANALFFKKLNGGGAKRCG